MIIIENKQNIPVNTDALHHDAKKILTALGYADFDLGILLCDSIKMKNYNKKYRDKDTATDVLSFPLYPEIKPEEKIKPCCDEEKNLGDLIICPEYVRDDLERWNQTFEKRMQVLLVHGICHLLGYDHINDEDYVIMDAKEQELLKLLQ